MLADFFYLFGILYFWQKLAPKGVEIFLREIRSVKDRRTQVTSAELRAKIYRDLFNFGTQDPLKSRILQAMDREPDNIEQLQLIHKTLLNRPTQAEQKTG